MIDILKESTDLYKSFLELEYKKYDAVIKNDIELLDDIVSKEQVHYMKMRGLDQKREKLVDAMGCKGMTLKEIIKTDKIQDNNELTEKYNELSEIIFEVKKINSLCKTLIEVRMHKIDDALVQLGEKDNTYSNTENKNNNGKSLIFSKKI
ncbi:flagellar protein FlgN [Sedimentibacter sp.]|uniref:flagellar protein FlgN n=1 Tax=Sedimentibacter sp. TaxID=1960295 RepID=UPI0028A65CAB|nr:flagellar protein FlgN [Sedimentibacter sp.]